MAASVWANDRHPTVDPLWEAGVLELRMPRLTELPSPKDFPKPEPTLQGEGHRLWQIELPENASQELLGYF